MTDVQLLPLQGGQLNVTKTSQVCSAGLWRLLTDEKSKAETALKTIIRSDGLQREVRSVAAVIQQRARPATGPEVIAALVRIMPHYGVVKRTEAENKALAEVYVETLSTLPLEAIQEALREWGREDQAFMPNSGQIYSRAKPHAERLWMAAYRAKRAAEYVEKNPPPKTAEEIAADRQKAIDMGLMDPVTGKMIVNLPSMDMPGPRGTPQQEADRVRKVADAMEQRVPTPPPEPI